MPFRIWLSLLLLVTALHAGEIPWEKLEGCTLIHDRWQDGDSFHALHNGRDYIFRLYFVDTPESEARFPERVAEQGAYFGVSSERAMELGHIAADFTAHILGAKPFTVWTHWKDALGASSQQRFYAFVETDQGSLGELLVANGLARIYGVKTPLPDGTDSRTYLARLDALKEKAHAAHLGGWGTSATAPVVEVPAAVSKPEPATRESFSEIPAF